MRVCGLCLIQFGSPLRRRQLLAFEIQSNVRTLEDLRGIQEQLSRAGIRNSGIQKDRYGQKEFIWLDDPDNMRIEFYVRPL